MHLSKIIIEEVDLCGSICDSRIKLLRRMNFQFSKQNYQILVNLFQMRFVETHFIEFENTIYLKKTTNTPKPSIIS